MFLNGTEIPACLLQLGEVAREKAIEIANALLTIGMEENKTLRIAIATVKHLAKDGTAWFGDDEV